MAAGKPTPFVDTTSSGRESLKIMARASLASSSVPTALVEPTHVPIGDEELLPVAHVADESVREVLWGDAPQSTTGLAYIESHAMRMRARVRREDPHSSYLPLRSKSLDVRLFKVATLIATTPLEHERCDFRGVTRVPGDLDTVLGLLASEDARESYWVALNTQRGLLVHSLVATRRLTDAAFPRWNQRYSAIKFSKQAPPVECCVSEYAAYDDPEDEDEDELAARRTRVLSQDVVGVDGKPLRSAFVYRRSIDHRLFNMEDVQDKLRQYGEHCERLYVQDFLYEIAETPEKHTCKVVLTCSVYLTNAHGQLQHEAESEKLAKSLRHEYREFCTQSLLSLRQVMANQWVEKMTYAGVVSKSSNALRSLLSGGSATRSHQPLHCGVCSAAFSLLKKRHVCHECGLVVCSRCCVKPAPTPPSPQPQDKQMTGSQVLKAMATAHDRQRPTRECILCTQFGNDSGGSDDLRVSVSIRRHFTNSTTLSSLAPGELPDDTLSDSGLSASNQMSEDQSDCGDLDDEEVHVVEAVDDLDALDGNQAQDKPVKPRNLRVRASTEDNTITTAWREPGPELAPPYRAMPPTIAIQQPVRRRFKQRAESVNLATPAPSPGLVLLTEIDTLSLTGSFRLDGSASSAASRRGSGSSDTGRRGSGASDAGRRSGGSDAGSVASTASAPSAHNFVRASPALPPRRARRSVSEDTTRPPTSVALEPLAVAAKVETGEDEEDDLANFNLQLL